jgi:hypothetical protein
MKRIKVIGPALVAAFALSAVAASAASAHSFESTTNKYPVHVTAIGGIQTFEAAAAKSVCEKLKAGTGEEGAPDPTGPSESLEIHPKYEKCNVTISGVNVPATVTTTGCNYVFHAAAVNTKEGTVDVKCVTGKSINIALEGVLAGCVISVTGTGTGVNAGLKSIEYRNEPAGEVTVNAAVKGITWKATEKCGIGLGGAEATYTGSAVSKGVFGEFAEADPIKVS